MSKEENGIAALKDLKVKDANFETSEINTDPDYCPTYINILNTSRFSVNNVKNYASNQLVKFDDIGLNEYTWMIEGVYIDNSLANGTYGIKLERSLGAGGDTFFTGCVFSNGICAIKKSRNGWEGLKRDSDNYANKIHILTDMNSEEILKTIDLDSTDHNPSGSTINSILDELSSGKNVQLSIKESLSTLTLYFGKDTDAVEGEILNFSMNTGGPDGASVLYGVFTSKSEAEITQRTSVWQEVYNNLKSGTSSQKMTCIPAHWNNRPIFNDNTSCEFDFPGVLNNLVNGKDAFLLYTGTRPIILSRWAATYHNDGAVHGRPIISSMTITPLNRDYEHWTFPEIENGSTVNSLNNIEFEESKIGTPQQFRVWIEMNNPTFGEHNGYVSFNGEQIRKTADSNTIYEGNINMELRETMMANIYAIN